MANQSLHRTEIPLRSFSTGGLFRNQDSYLNLKGKMILTST